VPHSYINPWIFEFSEEKTFAPRYGENGYEKLNFIKNSGSVFWFLFAWLFFALFTLFLSLFKANKRIHRVETFLSRYLFYSIIIRLFIESYLEIMLSALINIKNLNWKLSGDIIASLFTIGSIIITFAFPAFLHYFL